MQKLFTAADDDSEVPDLFDKILLLDRRSSTPGGIVNLFVGMKCIDEL